MESEEKIALYICMGSACHQLGVYKVLPLLQELITAHQLDDRLELRGAFCLGTCAHGVVVKMGEDLIQDITPRNVREKFEQEILVRLQERSAA